MPRKKTGAVERRGDKYLARIGRERLGSFDSEEQAWRVIEAALIDDAKRTGDTFGELGEAYMQNEEQLHRKRRGNVSMFDKEWSLWDRHIRPAKFYRMRAKDIRREHVQQLLDEIVKKPALHHAPLAGGGAEKVDTGRRIGERTPQKVRSRLSLFFDTVPGLPTGNPARGTKIPKVRKIKQRVDGDRKPHLHADEIDRLFALPELIDEHRAVYALGIYAGLRVDEIWGLRWENVVRLDGDEPELHIRWSYDAPTKTQSSQREIPMLPQLVAALRRYRDSLPAAPIAGVVFPGDDGGIRCDSSNARWTDKRRRKNGEIVVRTGYRTLASIRDHIHFMHLRHTCATHLLKGTFFASGHEWPIEKVSEMLGHDDVQTTTSHYASRGVDRLHKEMRAGLEKQPVPLRNTKNPR